jgi:hypothetical protein
MTARTVALNEAGRRIGEAHPQARYTDGEIEMVLKLRDEGMGYKRIARAVEMPIRTVRGICNGSRRGQWAARWKSVAD